MTFRTVGLLIAVFVAAWMIGCTQTNQQRGSAPVVDQSQPKWAIVIHGGAGMLDRSMPADLKLRYEQGLTSALQAGRTILAAGGSSLDAVEAAVRSLEDNELFNAGRGAVLTRAGTCELDASIMDGRTLKCGAGAGLRTVRNPITFARRVMEQTPHILFTGDGAETVATQLGVERVDPGYFITPRRREQLDKRLKELGLTAAPSDDSLTRGTVGCVAIDIRGDIAAATSTGGMTAKMPGRVGDSPLIGAGCYANNATLGVSCTGTGEQFIRHVAAHDLSALVRYKGLTLEQAASVVLTERLEIDDGGLIAIDRAGNIVATTTTGCMPRAWARSDGATHLQIWDDDR
jgi:beta-aspartyl-peptidase (threonine type)